MMERPKVTLEYSSSGVAVSDFEIESVYDVIRGHIRHHTSAWMIFSTSLIFDRVRAAIAEGEISHEDIQFLCPAPAESNDAYTEVAVNQYGAIIDWPREFCHTGFSNRILTAANRKKFNKHIKEVNDGK
jgi:hypothetical protein